jgi:hypothetical protein
LRPPRAIHCTADIKGELLRLNRGVLFMFLELLQVLVAQPSQYSSSLSEIMGSLFNMNHLINMARPLQVRQRGLGSAARSSGACRVG